MDRIVVLEGTQYFSLRDLIGWLDWLNKVPVSSHFEMGKHLAKAVDEVHPGKFKIEIAENLFSSQNGVASPDKPLFIFCLDEYKIDFEFMMNEASCKRRYLLPGSEESIRGNAEFIGFQERFEFFIKLFGKEKIKEPMAWYDALILVHRIASGKFFVNDDRVAIPLFGEEELATRIRGSHH